MRLKDRVRCVILALEKALLQMDRKEEKEARANIEYSLGLLKRADCQDQHGNTAADPDVCHVER